MILVVGLSPAIDVTYEVDKLVHGKSLRVSKIHKVPGGKSVNVAAVLKQNQQRVDLLLPLGGDSGNWLARKISDLGIQLHRVDIQNETRTCVAVVDTEATVFNEPAADLTSEEFNLFLEKLKSLAANYSVIVFSGSIPKSIAASAFAQLVRVAAGSAKVILDTSGEYLMSGAAENIEIAKPNNQELMEATKESNLENAIEVLLKTGAKQVLVSLGEEGAQLHTATAKLQASSPKLSGNATGAGDAMVAGLAMGLIQNLASEELLKQAVAFGSAAVLEPVAGSADPKNVAKILEDIQISEVR